MSIKLNYKSVFFDIQFLLLALIVLTLPFSINFNSFLIIIASVNALFILTRFNVGKAIKAEFMLMTVLAIPFIMYVLVFALSWDFSFWPTIEKKFSLFAFPIIFVSCKDHLNKKQLYAIMDGFLVSTLASTMFTLLTNTSEVLKPEIIGLNLIIDRPYFGLYIFFCVFLLVYKVIQAHNFFFRALYIVIIIYLVFFCFMLLTKIALIGFFVAILASTVFYLLLLGKLNSLLAVMCGLVAFLIVFITFSNPRLAAVAMKIVNFQPLDLSNGQWVYYLSINMRMTIWDCSWQLLIQDQNWLTGCGLDHQKLLTLCNNLNWSKYNVNTFDGIDETFLARDFNAHNEYLSTWLDIGLAGLVGFLVCLVWSFRVAYTKSNILHIAFIIFFSICCLTESLLTRQKGIVFFAMFNSLFIFFGDYFSLIISPSFSALKKIVKSDS